MVSVQTGASRAIDECKFQFRTRRWNCSTLDDDQASGGNGKLPTSIVPLQPPPSKNKKKSKGKKGGGNYFFSRCEACNWRPRTAAITIFRIPSSSFLFLKKGKINGVNVNGTQSDGPYQAMTPTLSKQRKGIAASPPFGPNPVVPGGKNNKKKTFYNF